ncbi:hypothetical protein ANCCAN_11279 [Ancylostoma caninum]|uniref:Uncharacterized protein n=1 Tax=Ancylostoma caninum TaxID=29170 RepID=A0A368GED4_ANCCA|nr:hypothetical protein ANCCAN_11279 [Ancylostoma caninum]
MVQWTIQGYVVQVERRGNPDHKRSGGVAQETQKDVVTAHQTTFRRTGVPTCLEHISSYHISYMYHIWSDGYKGLWLFFSARYSSTDRTVHFTQCLGLPSILHEQEHMTAERTSPLEFDIHMHMPRTFFLNRSSRDSSTLC